MLGRGAGAGRGDARDDQRSVADILDDKGMRDLTISLLDRAEVELFILQRLKGKLGKSIPRVQMLLANLNPLQLLNLEL